MGSGACILSYSTYVRAGKREEIDRLELQAESLSEVIHKEIDILGLNSGMSVLDAGCGTGAITRRIAGRVKPSVVVGIDIDPTFLEASRKLAADHGIDNIRFEAGDAQNLEYEDRTFDVSYCRLVLSHVDDPLESVSELRRVTKTRGLVASSDEGGAFYVPSLPKVDKLVEKMYQTLFRSREERIRRFGSAHSLFSSAGLQDIEVHHIPIFASQRDPERLRKIASVPLEMVRVEMNSVTGASVVSKEEFEEAVKEFESWLQDATAFWMVLSIMTIGRVHD